MRLRGFAFVAGPLFSTIPASKPTNFALPSLTSGAPEDAAMAREEKKGDFK